MLNYFIFSIIHRLEICNIITKLQHTTITQFYSMPTNFYFYKTYFNLMALLTTSISCIFTQLLHPHSLNCLLIFSLTSATLASITRLSLETFSIEIPFSFLKITRISIPSFLSYTESYFSLTIHQINTSILLYDELFIYVINTYL